MAALHITNGDCAVEVLRKTGMQGDILPWRDVLHEGPVDSSLPLEDLSTQRIDFIAQAGWAPRAEVEKGFRERDARVRASARDDEVVLWFEHDLYDQLQLIQLLAWFAEHPHPRLALICEAEYLSEMKPARAADLFAQRKAITPKQLEEGAKAWRSLKREGAGSYPSLPFLDAALERLRQEPQRTEALIIEALAGGPLDFAALFRATQAKDEPRFLGDTVFLKRLERLEGLGRVRRAGTRWALA